MRGVDYVLHQAALPSVPRSVSDPLASHECNATGTLNLLIAARDAGVKRVVLTSSFAPEEQREAKRLGADRYLKKPVDLYHFLNDVGKTLREMLTNRVLRDSDGKLTR